jgi:hypothetical protein
MRNLLQFTFSTARYSIALLKFGVRMLQRAFRGDEY